MRVRLGALTKKVPAIWIAQQWGRSSAGRAPALQAGGQEFDSPRLHQICLYLENYIEEDSLDIDEISSNRIRNDSTSNQCEYIKLNKS